MAELTSSSKRFSLLTWGTLLGGGIAWFVQLLALYLLAEFGCVSNWQEEQLFGLGGVAWGVIIVTLIALAVSGGCCGLGWMARNSLARRRQDPPSVSSADKDDSTYHSDGEGPERSQAFEHFLIRCSVLINTIFAFIILAQGLPILFYLSRC